MNGQQIHSPYLALVKDIIPAFLYISMPEFPLLLLFFVFFVFWGGGGEHLKVLYVATMFSLLILSLKT